MQREFEDYLCQVCRCTPGSTFLVAVSGGIDSVVMAELFYKAGATIAFAHCNFKLRDAESDCDEAFVQSLASRMKIPCHITRFNTREHAESRGISIQMAARDLRYGWFHSLKEQHGYNYIAVGHNANDDVETLLLNLSRGCGIHGLSGMKPSQGAVVRPLLFARRGDIRKYAEDHHIDWREDSSNAEIKYTRNRIRLVVIPEFEAINMAFTENTRDTIARLAQAEQLLDYTVEIIRKEVWTEKQEDILIDLQKLRTYPAVETLLFELLREFGFTQPVIRSMVTAFDSSPGKQFLTQSHCVTRDRRHLIVTRNRIPENTEMLINRETALVAGPVHLNLATLDRDADYVIPEENNVAALDADKLDFPLKLRTWKAGDSFHPLGMKGTKKISDYLINRKVPLPDKQEIRVIESGSDIVWIVNHRIDERYKVTPKTRRVLQIEYRNTIDDQGNTQ